MSDFKQILDSLGTETLDVMSLKKNILIFQILAAILNFGGNQNG